MLNFHILSEFGKAQGLCTTSGYVKCQITLHSRASTWPQTARPQQVLANIWPFIFWRTSAARFAKPGTCSNRLDVCSEIKEMERRLLETSSALKLLIFSGKTSASIVMPFKSCGANGPNFPAAHKIMLACWESRYSTTLGNWRMSGSNVSSSAEVRSSSFAHAQMAYETCWLSMKYEVATIPSLRSSCTSARYGHTRGSVLREPEAQNMFEHAHAHLDTSWNNDCFNIRAVLSMNSFQYGSAATWGLIVFGNFAILTQAAEMHIKFNAGFPCWDSKTSSTTDAEGERDILAVMSCGAYHSFTVALTWLPCRGGCKTVVLPRTNCGWRGLKPCCKARTIQQKSSQVRLFIVNRSLH